MNETKQRSIDLRLWRKLFSYTRSYRPQVGLLGVFAIGTATVEVLYPLLTRRVIDDVARGVAGDQLVFYGASYFGLTVTISICIFGFIWMAGFLRTHVSHDIRRDGFQSLQKLSFSFYDQRSVGWLMSRMTSDCERLSNILSWGVLDLIWAGTMMSGISVAMFGLNVKLALTVLAVIPLLAIVSAVFQRRILKTARKVRKLNSRITASYNESLMGNRTSKVFVRERANAEEFGELSGEMNAMSVRNALLSAVYLPLVMTIGSLAAGLALVVGGFDVIGGTLTIGTLVAFMTYSRNFFMPIQDLAAWFAEMQMAQASAERIVGLIESEPEIRDSAEVRAAIERHGADVVRQGSAAATNGDAPLAIDGRPDRVGEIELRDVSFEYVGGVRVLDRFNLRVKAGETIALVGSTGGGKTTILSLVCRFYEPTAGQILIDGVDYRERSLRWFQSNFGIVLQAPHLFSGTIAENIRYGRLDASDDEVAAAAKLVGAHEFITAMENGYASEVGESGNRLSTGEKQLISFARAILARPRVLVMDEATSSIDTETERRIQQGLEKVLEGRTSFVIAHRLSTIRAADRIVVIEHGRIGEQGSHEELIARRGRYWELYRQQSVRESLGAAT